MHVQTDLVDRDERSPWRSYVLALDRRPYRN